MSRHNLPRPMRESRRAKTCNDQTYQAWWYITPSGIEVYAGSDFGGVTGAKLTRRQLQTALKIMRDAEHE